MKAWTLVFWPDPSPKPCDGFLVGWASQEGVWVVAATVSLEDVETLQARLAELKLGSSHQQLASLAGGWPALIGSVNAAPPLGHAGRWLHLRVPSTGPPEVSSIHDRGVARKSSPPAALVQYPLGAPRLHLSSAPALLSRFADPSTNSPPPHRLPLPDCSLDLTLRRLHTAASFASLLLGPATTAPRPPRSLPLLGIASLAASISSSLPAFASRLSPPAALSCSSFFRDTCARIRAASRWSLATRDGGEAAGQRLRAVNRLLMATLDCGFGFVMGALLLAEERRVADWLPQACTGVTDLLVEPLVRWLMGWPSGFKLNDPLDLFVGKASLAFLSFWSAALRLLLACVTPMLLRGVAAAGVLGLSAQLLILRDLLAVCTFHACAHYRLILGLLRVHVGAMKSLFLLFWGKKYNVMRRRVDLCDYGVNQLLLGTLLFTVLFFLFPTVAFYFLCMWLVQMLVALASSVLSSTALLLRSLPLFPLLLALFSPDHLSRGVSFTVFPHFPQSQSSQSPPLYLRLIPERISCQSIVGSYLFDFVRIVLSQLCIVDCLLDSSKIQDFDNEEEEGEDDEQPEIDDEEEDEEKLEKEKKD